MPDSYPAATTQYYRRCEIALIRRHVPDLAGKRVLKLDLWNEAVNTRILQWMQTQGAEAYGLDLSAVTTDRARANARPPHPYLHIVQADIRALPFASESFDFVYTMGTIEHVEEYQQATDEVGRVLRPGGLAIVGVPHKWNLYLRPLLVWALEAVGRYAYSPERSFSARELRVVLEKSGLRMVHRTGILSIPPLLRMADLYLHRRGVSLGRALRPLLDGFAWAEARWEWAGRLGYLLAQVARKPPA
jgi:SAM-dependent methyltransferase